MPSTFDTYTKKERKILLALALLNEEEKEKRLIRAIAKGVSLAMHGGSEQ